MIVKVTAPARLHFGFINLDGSLGRVFGGIGLAIDEPRVVLEATRAKRLSVTGDESGRAEASARRFLRHFQVREGVHVSIKEMIPAHVGLGSGTQLALAVAAALARLLSVEASVRELASVMGRGRRSGIGIAAFERGGFIVDGGHRSRSIEPASETDLPPPAIVRHPFPREWVFVVAIPRVGRGLAGGSEERAFQRLAARPATGATTVSRMVLMEMLPALLERDAATFGRSLTSVQQVVGKWFRVVQGGTFACPEGRELAILMSRAGALGIGQSSWGPTVYGMAPSQEAAKTIKGRIEEAMPGGVEAEVFLARASNRGAVYS